LLKQNCASQIPKLDLRAWGTDKERGKGKRQEGRQTGKGSGTGRKVGTGRKMRREVKVKVKCEFI